MIFVVLLYSLFASVFIFQKAALDYTQPLFLVGSRMAVAGILLLGYAYFFKGEKLKPQKRHLLLMLALAFFNIYMTNILEVWGLKYLTAAKTCFFYSLSPYLAALLSYALYNEKMSIKKWVGLTIGFIGFIPILVNHTTEEEAFGSFFIFSWPELAVMGAAFCSVYGWILLGQLVKQHSYSPMMANGYSMLIGGVMALVNSALIEEWNPVPVTEFMPFIKYTGLLLLVSNLMAYNFYGFLLKRFSATFLSFAGFITPLLTALFGWLILSEEISWPFYLSAAIVFCGLLIFYQEELNAGYEAVPQRQTTT